MATPRKKTGFILKSKTKTGYVAFDYLLRSELHLISTIINGAKDNTIEVKKVEFETENEFILMKF